MSGADYGYALFTNGLPIDTDVFDLPGFVISARKIDWDVKFRDGRPDDGITGDEGKLTIKMVDKVAVLSTYHHNDHWHGCLIAFSDPIAGLCYGVVGYGVDRWEPPVLAAACLKMVKRFKKAAIQFGEV